MGEVVVETSYMGDLHLAQGIDHSFNNAMGRSSRSAAQVIPITTSPSANEDGTNPGGVGVELDKQDAWLPLTESRNGSTLSVTFHLLCSGLGIQALSLPAAFATLGWAWGCICLLLAFAWQLYTIRLLVLSHESDTGTRSSRYIQLAIKAFGQKLGKLLVMFPMIYLSNGACVQLIITGGLTMELFFKTVCNDGATAYCHPMTGTECFLVFTIMAIVVAQLPNLNSITWVSLVGSITAIVYCTMIWSISIAKGRPSGISYNPPEMESDMDRFGRILNAIGIVFLAFRGHNVILEIQGTLPSNPKHPIHKRMWRGVIISYAIIAICMVPLAIAGFWVHGNKVSSSSLSAILSSASQLPGHNKTSRSILGVICILVILHCLSTFQIYGMVVYDNLESKYTMRKNRPCARRLRVTFRVLFGGLAFFAAVTFPFLVSLAPLIGGLTLPMAYAYPCFMWIALKKPKPNGLMWCINVALGCLGLVLSVVLVVAATWNLAQKGLNANFFKP
ncbi:PREDICTED: lysine histidine transporter-like 8 [Fragaria vesca subsp. vesca]|uniref:lysine histidine transporter-like 8 n=1 Tax=Fragaria vesca subsp. vesca TaxID=101020 RepID=UPI0002C3683F|nr:PREDICTED: lysine histidine transporter-like 8 [Fragaria vesca subsp. vesca]